MRRGIESGIEWGLVVAFIVGTVIVVENSQESTTPKHPDIVVSCDAPNFPELRTGGYFCQRLLRVIDRMLDGQFPNLIP